MALTLEALAQRLDAVEGEVRGRTSKQKTDKREEKGVAAPGRERLAP